MKMTKYLFAALLIGLVAACSNEQTETQVTPAGAALCDCDFDKLETVKGNVIFRSTMSLQKEDGKYLVVCDAVNENLKVGFDHIEYDTVSVPNTVKMTIFYKTGIDPKTTISYEAIDPKYSSYEYEFWVNIDGAQSKKGTRVRTIAAVNGSVPIVP